MIEVNLLPGAKKSKKKGGGGGGPSINFAALGASLAARFKDTWLTAAIGTGIVVVLVVGFMFLGQQRKESSLREAETKELADSARYATVLRDRALAQARRDSALLQLSIIKAIDEERYIWPHVLEEVSRSLPIYTWLRVVNFYGTAQGLTPAATIKSPPPDTGKVKRRRAYEVTIPRDTVRIRLQGRTVDMQAFTRFMRTLEESPFFQSITMERSEPIVESGKDIVQFTLVFTYSRPDSLLLRREPLMLTPIR